jgi:hypothetical protein
LCRCGNAIVNCLNGAEERVRRFRWLGSIDDGECVE